MFDYRVSDTTKSKFINSYVLFISVFLFHLIWIFQGLDVSDHGWHLSIQVRPFSDNGDLANMFSLSNFFGGMWLKIINAPNILWARLGGVLLFSLNALLAYKILSVYFDRKKVFFVVFASTLFITMRASALIHYFNFPALLLNLEVLIFNQLLNKPVDRTSFKVYSFLLGFISIPIILGRFSLILIVFIPVLVFLYFQIAKEDTTGLKKSSPYITLGTAISLVIFALFYKSVGFFNIYLESIKTYIIAAITGKGLGETLSIHEMSSMVKRYINEYRLVLDYTVIASISLYVISLLKKRLGNRIANLILVVLTLLGSMLVIALKSDVNFYAYSLIKLSIGLIILVSFIFFMHDKGRNRNLSLLLLVSVFVMIINHIGSGFGVIKSRDGMWLSLPLVFLIIYELRENIDSKRLKSIFSLNTVVISLLVVISLFLHFTNVYRDNQNRFKLNTEFKYKYLRHVYSHKERVEVVDETLMQIDQLTEKNDVVLMINEIPMFYYLTQTKPFFGEPWPFLESLAKIKIMYEKAIEDKRYPKLFVYSKTDTTSWDWPNDVVADDEDLPKLEYLKDKYINELNYNLVWENSAFVIYSRL